MAVCDAKSRYCVIYLANYVGPQARTARDIATDSTAASKKVVDLARAMEAAGLKVLPLSLGWKRATWSLCGYPAMAESVDGRWVCEYAGLRDFPVLNLITNVTSMCRLVAKRAAEERAKGFSCRLLFYNPTLPMTLVALYARLLVGLPIYLELEDGTHLIPTLGIFRRLAYVLSHKVLQRLISGVILVSPLLRKGYEDIPHVICRGVATPELASTTHSRLDDSTINQGRGVITVLFSSMLDEIRGVGLLMRALEQADGELDFPASRFRFIITGKGPLEAQTRDCCKALKRIRADFMGFVDLTTYRKILAEAQVAVALQDPAHPYSRACFPSKVIEYMTAGKLVLTTEVADIMEYGNGGVVPVHPSTPESLVRLWRDILDNPTRYAQIAAVGQAFILKACSPERTGLEIASLLQ